MHEELGSFWLYNIYDSCGGDEAAARPQRLLDWFELGESGHYQLRAHVLGRLGDYKCGSEGAMVKYLADPKVAAAIHVREGTGGMRYKLTVPDLRPLYKCGPTLSTGSMSVLRAGDFLQHMCACLRAPLTQSRRCGSSPRDAALVGSRPAAIAVLRRCRSWRGTAAHW